MNLRVLALLAFCLCLLHGGRASGAGSSVLLDIEPTKDHPRNSEGSFAALKSGRLIFYYSQYDHSGRFPFAKGKRTPLVAAISSDDGKTWPLRKIIEDDPSGWYCYTAMHFTDDAVLLAYCAGDTKIGGLNRLRIRRIPLDWLPAQ